MRLLTGLAATLALGLSSGALAAPAKRDSGGVYTTTTTATSITVATTTTTAVTTTTSTAIVYETAYVIENLEAPCLAGASTSAPIATAVAEGQQGGSNSGSPSSPGSASASSGSGANMATSGSGTGSSSSSTSITTGTSGSNPGTPVNTTGSPTILNPITPPSVNPGDLTNLQPSSNGSYYYTPGGNPDTSIEHQFAEMNLTYQYPTVVLPHSAYVSGIQCLPNGQGLEIDFNSTDAYNYVKSHWTNGSFLLVTYSLGCEANTGEEAGDHVYWLVKDLVYDDGKLSVRVDAAEVAYEDAMDEVHLIWGNNVPQGGNGTDVSISHSAGDGSPSTGSYNYNVSSPTTGGNSTCAAPPPNLNLPTAPCGPDFDVVLDSEIGYFDFDNDEATDLEQFAPGLGNDVSESEVDSINTLAKRKRPKVAKIQQVDKKTSGTAEQKSDAGKLSQLVKSLPPIKPTRTSYSLKNLDPKFDIEFETRNSPNQLQDSPWGQAYNIYHVEKKGTTKAGGSYDASLDLYCVDCHFNAGVTVHGEITWSALKRKVYTGYVSMNGNVDAGVYLGLDAKASFEAKQTRNVLKQGIPGAGVAVKKVFSAGMVVSIDVTAAVGLNAQTQILAGVGMTIPNFQAKLDFVNGGSYANGFTPQFTNRFEANGSATATLELGLPIGLAAEISVLGFNPYAIGLKNTPSIKGTAALSVGTANTLQSDASCNNGLELSLGVADVTSVEFLGKVKEFAKFEKDKLLSKCIQIPGLAQLPPSTGGGDAAASGDDTTAADSSFVDDNGTFAGTGDQDGSGDQVDVPAADDNSFTDDASDQQTDVARRRSYRRSILKARDTNTTTNGTAYGSFTETYNSTAGDVTYFNATSGASFNSSDAAGLANVTTTYGDDLSNGTLSSDNTTQTLIYDSTGSYVLGQDEYNNFFLDDAANAEAQYQFTAVDDVVVTDVSDRAMFYYPDEMTALGVSRFRIADTTQIPTAADFITLTPIDADESTSTPGVYLAVDSEDNAYYTMYCNIDGLGGKIFLVDDLDAGAKTLMRTDLEMVITGGVVTDCQALELVSETFAGF